MSTTSPAERLSIEGAFLYRTDLAHLGIGRRDIDRVFQACRIIALGKRPMIRVEDFNAYMEKHTYRGDRVRPRS